MIDTETDPSQTLRPLERHPQLETDKFCEQCGYNLHGQTVTRDDRTQIMICRCPECGRYAAAGKDGAAGTVWLSRLVTALLAVWVMIMLNVFGWGGFLLGVWPYGYLMSRTTSIQATPDGRRVEFLQTPATTTAPSGDGKWVIAGTNETPAEVLYLRVQRFSQLDQEWFSNPTMPIEYRLRWQREMMWIAIVLVAVAALNAMLIGMFIAVAMWHVRRSRALWGVILPLLACTGAWLVWVMEEDVRLIRTWSQLQIGMFLCAEIAGMVAGLWLGRPLARAMSRMFIPPRPRQCLAFLWYADGKSPPPVSPAR